MRRNAMWTSALALLVASAATGLSALGDAGSARGDAVDTRRLDEAPIAPDTVPIPDTPAGRRARALLTLLAEPDSTRLHGFVQEAFAPSFRDAFPIRRHLEILGQVARETGGLIPVEVRRSSETVLALRVRNRADGEFGVFRLEVEDESPHRVVGASLRPAGPADAVPIGDAREGPLTDHVLARELGEYVDRLAEADAFSGVLLVARGDSVLLQSVHGEANKRYGVPNRPDTKFNLGSMNKMFTAVAIARLVEEGRLSYGDSIGRYLGEEWVRPEVGEEVRIEHLLTHTSGLGSYFNEEFQRSSRARFRDVDDYRPLVREDSLRFEPGTDWAYSNTGFLLLGAVIEAVTGQEYEEYVREAVYRPAGMESTGTYAMDEPVPNLAYGYSREETPEGVRYRNNLFQHVIRGGPAGGGFSTAPDLLSFARALREGRLVSEEAVERLTTPKPELGSPEYGYGFGFWQDGRFYGHTGGFEGISSALLMERDAAADDPPLTVVVLSNYSGGSGPVLEKMQQLLEAGR